MAVAPGRQLKIWEGVCSLFGAEPTRPGPQSMIPIDLPTLVNAVIA